MSTEKPQSDSSTTRMPEQGLRTFLSLLILFHLFALFIAVASNAQPLSGLRNALGQRSPGIKPYLRLLNMDLAYNYHLTYGPGNDSVGRIELDVTPVEGEQETISFPPQNIWPNQRAARYRALTFYTANFLNESDLESIFPLEIAHTLLAEKEIREGTHRIRILLHRPDAQEQTPLYNDQGIGDFTIAEPYADSYYVTGYRGDIKFLNDALSIIKQEDALQTAPVVPQNRLQRTPSKKAGNR